MPTFCAHGVNIPTGSREVVVEDTRHRAGAACLPVGEFFVAGDAFGELTLWKRQPIGDPTPLALRSEVGETVWRLLTTHPEVTR